jgi:hypothetical protein
MCFGSWPSRAVTWRPVWIRTDAVLVIHQTQIAEHGGIPGVCATRQFAKQRSRVASRFLALNHKQFLAPPPENFTMLNVTASGELPEEELVAWAERHTC